MAIGKFVDNYLPTQKPGYTPNTKRQFAFEVFE